MPDDTRFLDLGDGGRPTRLPSAGIDVVHVTSRLDRVGPTTARHRSHVVEDLAVLSFPAFDVAAYAPPPAETKARVFECIDQAHRCLRVGGEFYLAGERAQGIDSIRRRAEAVFGGVRKVRQMGRRRVYVAAKRDLAPSKTPVVVDGMFESTIGGRCVAFQTKAGVFSRDHFDPGSRLLVDALRVTPGERVLDIGCGYGAIGISLAILGASVTMTDVDVRAVRCARENVARAGLEVEVIAGDMFGGIGDGPFDQVVSNPPFHAGRSFAEPLSSGAGKRLAPDGCLSIVVMRPEPYRRVLAAGFRSVEEIARADGYVVLRASGHRA